MKSMGLGGGGVDSEKFVQQLLNITFQQEQQQSGILIFFSERQTGRGCHSCPLTLKQVMYFDQLTPSIWLCPVFLHQKLLISQCHFTMSCIYTYNTFLNNISIQNTYVHLHLLFILIQNRASTTSYIYFQFTSLQNWHSAYKVICILWSNCSQHGGTAT